MRIITFLLTLMLTCKIGISQDSSTFKIRNISATLLLNEFKVEKSDIYKPSPFTVNLQSNIAKNLRVYKKWHISPNIGFEYYVWNSKATLNYSRDLGYSLGMDVLYLSKLKFKKQIGVSFGAHEVWSFRKSVNSGMIENNIEKNENLRSEIYLIHRFRFFSIGFVWFSEIRYSERFKTIRIDNKLGLKFLI